MRRAGNGSVLQYAAKQALGRWRRASDIGLKMTSYLLIIAVSCYSVVGKLYEFGGRYCDGRGLVSIDNEAFA